MKVMHYEKLIEDHYPPLKRDPRTDFHYEKCFKKDATHTVIKHDDGSSPLFERLEGIVI